MNRPRRRSDSANNRTGVAEANGDLVSWSYDEANQLTQEQRTGVNDYIYAYTYDEVGNRLTKDDGAVVVSYSYDEANQLTLKWSPTVRVTYSYDANGNTTLEDNANLLTSYSWDLENRVTGVALPAGGLNTMVYDGDGKRRSYADSVILRNFIWDGENIARQTDVNGATDRTYTLNPQVYGELISQDGPAFHHYDALGSTRNLTDGTQTVTDTRDYKAFGETNASSGTSPNRFWWLGQWGYYLQPDLGDIWVRARIVEPIDARWKSRDPLHYRAMTEAEEEQVEGLAGLWPLGSLGSVPDRALVSEYPYAAMDPLDLIDPSGQRELCPDELVVMTEWGRLFASPGYRMGYPHAMKHPAPNEIDCSHYLQLLFRKAGINMPYAVADQIARGKGPYKGAGHAPPCRPGEVMAYRKPPKKQYGHVLFVGTDGRCYHSGPSPWRLEKPYQPRGTKNVDCGLYVEWRRKTMHQEPVCIKPDIPGPTPNRPCCKQDKAS